MIFFRHMNKQSWSRKLHKDKNIAGMYPSEKRKMTKS